MLWEQDANSQSLNLEEVFYLSSLVEINEFDNQVYKILSLTLMLFQGAEKRRLYLHIFTRSFAVIKHV